MSQSKILVDTNVYLRLAQTIHPLLFTPFGADEHCLYVLPELNGELEHRRLQTKFGWTSESEYVENREHFPNVGRKQRRAIDETLGYVLAHVEAELPGPSEVDALYVAYAIELDIPVVTDDRDMGLLAEAFGVEAMSTLELLKLMLDCGHIDMARVESLRGYWQHIGDLPGDFRAEYRRLFGTKPRR